MTKKHSLAEAIANTFEWLITAFVLAFVFRAFVLEAFRIPTGSMADTLMGDHYRICCSQCGYQYEYNFNPYIVQNYKTAVGNGLYKLMPSPRCPSCGYYENPNALLPKANGDRILVLKCIYQFFEPKRWDVIVFKNPCNPAENYIKRLIGKPGETVEIIDGDIYINDELQRKPEKVQQEMWMCIYDNDFQPVRKLENRFNGHGFHQPFVNIKDARWKTNADTPTKYLLDCNDKNVNIMVYDATKGNDFRAVYAYGDPRIYDRIPYCSDLMLKYSACFKSDNASAGIGLIKYQTLYKAQVNADGNMYIEKISADGNNIILAEGKVKLPKKNTPFNMQFTDTDHLLRLKVNEQEINFDLGLGKNNAGERITDIQPKALVFGTGKIELNHLALYRDIHYLSERPDTGKAVNRAGEGNPFTLNKNEFFAMGDNSPDSSDSRLWPTEGIGNNAKTYRTGIVPRDYMVGKAFFVYWPSGFKPEKLNIGIIPNMGKMRFIHGGK